MKPALLQHHHPGRGLVILLALGLLLAVLVVDVNGWSDDDDNGDMTEDEMDDEDATGEEEKGAEGKRSAKDEDDDDDYQGYGDEDDEEDEDEDEYSHEMKYSFPKCEHEEDNECRDTSATVQNIYEELGGDPYGCSGKCGRDGVKDTSHITDQYTKEEQEIAAMTPEQFRKDKPEYVWVHEEYKDDPKGCGFPICVLIDAKPRRFRSLCRFMRYIKEEKLEHRIFHFQKGDCITAINKEGKSYQWGKKAEKCDHLKSDFNIPLCLVDFEKKSAFHFDNPCYAMQYMSYRKKAWTMYLMTGDSRSKDLCKYLKDDDTKIKTEWFDIDDPCLIGDAESAMQVYNYVTNYPLSAEFRFCNSKNLVSESYSPHIQTIHGQSLNDANDEGQITHVSRGNGGEFVCLNAKQDPGKKPGKPDYWFTKNVRCKDYRIQFKCRCFFGCKLRKGYYKQHGLSLTKWRVRAPKHKTLFDECTWQPYVSISSDLTWDAEVRHAMLWGRKKGADLSKEGDYGAFKGHACGDGHYDAMYIDVRRIKDSKPAIETGERISKETPHYGFMCFDKNQDGKTTCSNYKVRFCCAPEKKAMWGQWTKWSKCSKTCGGGKMKRQRICDQNSPNHSCARVTPDMPKTKDGKPIEIEEICTCNQIPCNLKSYCQWNDWSDWSTCSVTCGEGSKTRTRIGNEECEKRIPIPGLPGRKGICPRTDGAPSPCPDRAKEPEMYKKTRACKDQDCSDPIWGKWGGWSKCSATCGAGLKHRVRVCKDNMSGEKLPISVCRESTGGEDINAEPCDAGMCPIDWCWELWSRWSACSVHCGDGGTETRERACMDGQFGGPKCPKAKEVDKRDCGVKEKCPENCVWSMWGEWSECSKTCWKRENSRDRSGSKCRTRSKLKEAKYGGQECKENQGRMCEVCNLGPDDKCPHTCTWGRWGEWDGTPPICFDTPMEKKECEEEPEMNNFQRSRRKKHPPEFKMPCYDHKGKKTKEKQRKDIQIKETGCDYPICSAEKCMWAQWGEWGDCQGRCGNNGKMTKRRKCHFADGEEDPRDSPPEECRVNCQWWIDKLKKEGKLTAFEEVHKDCPNLCAHVGWTEWMEWGACSVTCGNGVRVRGRQCNRAGTDEIDAKGKGSVADAFCPSDTGNRREKEEQVCKNPKCDANPDCRHANQACEKEKARYMRRKRRRLH